MIFDVIPLKYPSHFPVGLRGKLNLWRNIHALKNFDKIITISQVSKKDLIKYLKIPEGKIEVIYPTLSRVFLNQKSNIKYQNKNSLNTEYSILNTPYCLYVGDVNWNKNLVNLVKAIKIANVNCVFVGKAFNNGAQSTEHEASTINAQGSMLNAQLKHPWQQEFKQFLEEVGGDPRFIFPGYVSDQELVELYKHATCNLLLSRDEGFGFSFIEAGSQACPSVLSDIPIFHETAENNALFANPEDPKAIAGQINKMFKDTKHRDQLGKQAQQYVLSKYSPDKFKSQLLQITNH